MRRRDFLLVPGVCFVPAVAPGQSSNSAVGVPFRQALLRHFDLARYATPEFVESIRDSHVLGLQVVTRAPSDGLQALVDLCRRSGIVVSYRYSVARDPQVWGEHPEWRLQTAGAESQGVLCLNSQYLQYVVTRNEEILRRHPGLAGALFEDWYFAPRGCSCRICVDERERMGWNAVQQNRALEQRAVDRLRTVLGSRSVAFQGVGLDLRQIGQISTHFEISDESPANWLRYLRGLGKEVVCDTADVRSAIRMAARGAKICATSFDAQWSRPVFRKLRDLEPWLRDARPVSDIGVWQGNEENCVRVLEAMHHQFDVVDAHSDLSAYRLLVVPVRALDDKASAGPLKGHIDRGGAVFAYGAEGPKDGKLDGSVLRVPRQVFDATAREQLTELLFQVLPKPAIQARNLPDSAEIHMFEQRLAGGMRRVVHVTQASSSGDAPLRDVQLWVRLPQHPLAVVTVPDLKPVEFVHNEFYTTFTIPRIAGHQAIAFE